MSRLPNTLLIFVCLFFLGSLSSFSQPYIAWQTVIGENEDEEIEEMLEVNGNYVGAGFQSNDGGFDDYDGLVIKVSGEGSLIWSTKIGDGQKDQFFGICKDGQGGFIVVGNSTTADSLQIVHNSDTTYTSFLRYGSEDFLVTRLNADGEVLWVEPFGGLGEEIAYDVVQTGDGNFAVAGYTSSDNGDISDPKGLKDFWLIKIDIDGELIWEKTFGGSSSEICSSLDYDPISNQLLLGGYTSSASPIDTSGDVTYNHGGRDIWFLRVDANNGDLVFQKSFGGSQGDACTSLTNLSDGGVAILGDSISSDGDLSENNGQDDWCIFRLDAAGEILWQKTVGLSSFDQSRTIIEASNGELIAIGVFYDESLAPPNFFYDIRVLKMDNETGEESWNYTFGGSLWDFGNFIFENSNGDFVVAGYTDSIDGDVGGEGRFDAPQVSDIEAQQHGTDNIWIFLLRDDSYVGQEENINTLTSDIKLFPNPVHNSLHIRLENIEPGKTHTEILIFNSAAQLMYQKKYLLNGNSKFSTEINTEQLASGIYQLIVDGLSTKVIVQH